MENSKHVKLWESTCPKDEEAQSKLTERPGHEDFQRQKETENLYVKGYPRRHLLNLTVTTNDNLWDLRKESVRVRPLGERTPMSHSPS